MNSAGAAASGDITERGSALKFPIRALVGNITAVVTFASTVCTPLYAQGASPAEIGAMQREYRRPPPRPIENSALVELGRDLFFAPQLSASGKTSCASCHFPELGWGVIDARSHNDSGKLTSRKSQPLIGLGHAGNAPVGWDGRSATLEAQAKSSIATGSMSMRETETPVKVELIEERIGSDRAYVAKFEAAMPGVPINIDSIVKAIAEFERTLEPGTAPFDRWIEGDAQAISASAKRGFVLFNGKANCFACHSGWRFTDDKFHDIGTTTTDVGRGRVDKDDDLMQFAFKTPTLRSVALRPPYMHNGSEATLRDVITLYEKGGIERPSRSPLMTPIALRDQERHDLIAFIKTLTEDAHAGMGSADE
jgi:cytochrome c peroxidase